MVGNLLLATLSVVVGDVADPFVVAPALAGVEIVGVAVGGFALSNSVALLLDQQAFDRERTGMQRNFG